MNTDKIVIRPYSSIDAQIFADIHYSSVHTLAKNHYPKEILDDWSPPVSEKRIQHLHNTEKEEIRVIAEYENKPAGLGVVIPEKNLLGACYVDPNFAHKGIGSKIVKKLETIAKSKNAMYLQMETSTNSKEFYEACGYEIIEKSFHTLRSGGKMDCYKMKKSLL